MQILLIHMQTLILQLLLLISVSQTDVCHPVHVSVTTVEFNADKQVFDIQFKFFTDDFCAIVFNKGIPGDVDSLLQVDNREEKIYEYINTHFMLSANRDKSSKNRLKFVGINRVDDSVFLRYEQKAQRKMDNITISNTLLTDLFMDQTNLLIFSYKDIQKGHQFTYSDISVDISLN